MNHPSLDIPKSSRHCLTVLIFTAEKLFTAVQVVSIFGIFHHHNRTEDPEATTPETTTVNYTTTEYIPPENWIEMFIWDQNGTTIDKYVDIPHRNSNYD